MATIFSSISAVWVLLPLRTPRQLMAVEHEKSDGGESQSGTGDVRQLEDIAGEGDGHGRHASGLDDEQQSPSVEECDGRVIGIAKVGVLSADCGHRGGQLGVDERAEQGDDAAGDPRAQDQRGACGPAARRHRG